MKMNSSNNGINIMAMAKINNNIGEMALSAGWRKYNAMKMAIISSILRNGSEMKKASVSENGEKLMAAIMKIIVCQWRRKY
jgi:hypothetical protein